MRDDNTDDSEREYSSIFTWLIPVVFSFADMFPQNRSYTTCKVR